MLAVSWGTVRLILHVLAATVWVGGQLTLAALVPVLRSLGAEIPRTAARRFNQVAWPAFAVLIVTGVWNLIAVRSQITGSYETTLAVKLIGGRGKHRDRQARERRPDDHVRALHRGSFQPARPVGPHHDGRPGPGAAGRVDIAFSSRPARAVHRARTRGARDAWDRAWAGSGTSCSRTAGPWCHAGGRLPRFAPSPPCWLPSQDHLGWFRCAPIDRTLGLFLL
jgi:hypothetical protein